MGEVRATSEKPPGRLSTGNPDNIVIASKKNLTPAASKRGNPTTTSRFAKTLFVDCSLQVARSLRWVASGAQVSRHAMSHERASSEDDLVV